MLGDLLSAPSAIAFFETDRRPLHRNLVGDEKPPAGRYPARRPIRRSQPLVQSSRSSSHISGTSRAQRICDVRSYESLTASRTCFHRNTGSCVRLCQSLSSSPSMLSNLPRRTGTRLLPRKGMRADISRRRPPVERRDDSRSYRETSYLRSSDRSFRRCPCRHTRRRLLRQPRR